MIQIKIFITRYNKGELTNIIYVSIVGVRFNLVKKIKINHVVLYYDKGIIYEMNTTQYCSDQ